MAALHVVGVDLQLGLGVHLGIVTLQDVGVALVGPRALGVLLYVHLAVEHTGALARHDALVELVARAVRHIVTDVGVVVAMRGVVQQVHSVQFGVRLRTGQRYLHLVADQCAIQCRGAEAEMALLRHAYAIEADVRRSVGLMLQLVDREARTFAHHALAHAVDEGFGRVHGDVLDDHLRFGAFMQHEQVAWLHQLALPGGDVQHMDRFLHLHAFGHQQDQPVGGGGGVHGGEEALARGCQRPVVLLHRAVGEVVLQTVDDQALLAFQIIAQVRAEVAVHEDDARGIKGKACRGGKFPAPTVCIAVRGGIGLVEQPAHAGVLPRFGLACRHRQSMYLFQGFGGARPGASFQQRQHRCFRIGLGQCGHGVISRPGGLTLRVPYRSLGVSLSDRLIFSSSDHAISFTQS